MADSPNAAYVEGPLVGKTTSRERPRTPQRILLKQQGRPEIQAVLSDIPNQTITEGSSFTTINLDDYVSDTTYTAADMVWTYTGNTNLTVSIVDRVATIGIPNADWNGAETITFRATPPDTLFDEKAAIFTVSAVNDSPIDISLSNSSVVENASINTVVGLISSIDPDSGDTFTYTLENGTGSTDNASFNIAGSSLRTSVVFNFEAKSSYSIRIRSTDQDGLSIEKAFTITITDANDAPLDIGLSNSSVAENAAINTVVGIVSTYDPDSSDTFTYSLVSGSGSTDNASFNIAGSSLRTSAIFNFETKSSYTIRIRSTDQDGLSVEKVFTITVADANETPIDISLSNSSVAENAAINTVVSIISTVDPDSSDTFTYSLVSGTGSTDNASFNIAGSSLRTSAIFNFENKSSYSIRIRSTDQDSLSVEKVFTITVADGNEAPIDISLSDSSVAENAAINTVVGGVSTIDPDSGNTFTYVLVSGAGSTDNASFNIAGSSLRTSSTFDFETKSSYSIRIRSTDQGSLSVEKVFTITVADANEAPIDINLSNSSVAENAAINTVIGIVSSIDPDSGNTFTYALVSGAGSTDNTSFNLAGSSLRTSTTFDFETKSSYLIRVRSTDQGSLSVEKQFTITITFRDTEKPKVNWVSPIGDGQYYYIDSRFVHLFVTATDNVGLTQVKFFRWDQEVLRYVDLVTLPNTPYEWILDTTILYFRWNQINVISYDTAGNVSDTKFIFLFRKAKIYLPIVESK